MDEVDVAKLSKKERREYFRNLQREQVEGEQRSKRRIKWGIVCVALILLGVGGWWVVREAVKPLPGKVVSDQGKKHIPKEEWEKFKYNSNPPTSGPHDAEWIRAGIYDAPQGDGHLVHSLEHGYVILHYSCNAGSAKFKVQSTELGTQSAALSDEAWKSQACQTLKEQLANVAKNKGLKKLIVVPRSAMETAIALTAWGRIDTLDQFDKDRIVSFIDAYRNRGPEQTME